jgi:hypothetical protein
MLRRLLAVVLMASLVGGAALADEIQVQGAPNLTSSRSIDDGELVGVGYSDNFVLNWAITESGGDFTYDYWFTGNTDGDPDIVNTWYLKLSDVPIPEGTITPIGDTLLSIEQDVPAVSGHTLPQAVVFTSPDGDGHYKFTTDIDPVWGNTYITNTGGDYAYNAGYASLPDDEDDWPLFTNYVAALDTGPYTPGAIVPEPSLSILALAALVAGAVARKRKKKEDED